MSFFTFRSRNPTARTTELLTEEFGEELLVYDQRVSRAHCLSAPAREVWHACDGKTSVEQLAPALGLEPQVVARALEELEACELLEGGVTRREATARLAKMGAAAVAAPLIYSVAAPPPVLAATGAACDVTGTGTGFGTIPGCGTSTSSNAFTTACVAAGCGVCQFSSCGQTPSCVGGQAGSNASYCVAACNQTLCNRATLRAKCCANSTSSATCVCNSGGGGTCGTGAGCLNN